MIYVRLAKATKKLESGILKKMPLRKSHDHVIFYLVSHIYIFAGLQMHAPDLHADLEEYPQAIACYEQVADYALTSPLTKYSVKEYWLGLGCVHLLWA